MKALSIRLLLPLSALGAIDVTVQRAMPDLPIRLLASEGSWVVRNRRPPAAISPSRI